MNDNLMFWVEWVKLTGEEKRNLLPHITDDDMLYDIAITSVGLRSDDFICDAVYGIKDDAMVVKLAAKVLPRCAESIVDRLGKSVWMLFDNDMASIRIASDNKLLTGIICDIDLNELSNHCSAHIYPAVRMCAFNEVVGRITHFMDSVDEYDQHLSFLQSMAMAEPDDHTRERMQSLLDGLTEDHI